jgi:hypothetical protein
MFTPWQKNIRKLLMISLMHNSMQARYRKIWRHKTFVQNIEQISIQSYIFVLIWIQKQSIVFIIFIPLAFNNKYTNKQYLKSLNRNIKMFLDYRKIVDVFGVFWLLHFSKLSTMSFPCIVCEQNVRPKQHALECDSCFQWQHRLCSCRTIT